VTSLLASIYGSIPRISAGQVKVLASCDGAFLNPVRKVYYAISLTGLSVAVVFLAGTIELVSVLHDNRRPG
jgi:high-affinity nickel permease